MLLELKVSHFAIIDSLQVHFLRPGLNVLTGETGAGKSILIKSLGLLMGGKASPEVIRTGKEQAIIEGAFDLTARPDIMARLQEMGLDAGEPLMVVRRIISTTGKHRLYINGSLATLNVLEDITSNLVEITGQHEHQSLSKKSAQAEIVDKFGDLLELRKKYRMAFERKNHIQRQIEELKSSSRDREMRADFLRFQVEEIDAFAPKGGEELSLEQELQRTSHSAKLVKYARGGDETLYAAEDAVLSRLSHLVSEGGHLTEIDPALKEPVENLKQAQMLLEEAAHALRKYAKGIHSDDDRLEEVRSRLAGYRKLQKKYGKSSEEIIAFRETSFTELKNIENSDENIKELENESVKAQSEMETLAKQLHAKRVKHSKELSDQINRELSDLNMKGTLFSISIQPTAEFSNTGQDDITFLIQPSPKDAPRPINKIASGGEMSRLMLALKQVVSMSDLPMTYLFDEVDAGVSGPTAEKVGKKLKRTARAHQVVCITHLPQVAAYADAHFLIAKEVEKGFVKSEVLELSEKERIQELARMISGEKTTASSLAHAREMLESASEKKRTGKLQ